MFYAADCEIGIDPRELGGSGGRICSLWLASKDDVLEMIVFEVSVSLSF